MKNICRKVLLSGVIMLAVACGANGQRNTAAVEADGETEFRLPEIPSMLQSPEERAGFLVENYWTNFDFSDTTLISKPELTEQAFADFLQVLPVAADESRVKGVAAMFDSAMKGDRKMFDHFAELSEKYLYDPNSPMRNEEMYIYILRYMVSSPLLDQYDKMRPEAHLQMALKNRVGQVANDFKYTLAGGATGRLSGIKADYTVVFFNNPDCHDCARVKDYIDSSAVFDALVGVKSETSGNPKVTVLALYPDADLALWRTGRYPKKWINAYDAGQVIEEEQLYDLKAIPTIYLLGSDKTVILKDTTVENLESWLAANLLQ